MTINTNQLIKSFLSTNNGQSVNQAVPINNHEITIHNSSNLEVFESKGENALQALTKANNANMSFIDRYKTNKLKSDKSREAQVVVYDTQLKVMKDEARAIEAKSKVYWDARISEFSEYLKVYGQDMMSKLDIQRNENLNQNLNKLYANTDRMIKDIELSDLNDTLKEFRIQSILNNMQATAEQIINQVTSKKYDLT